VFETPGGARGPQPVPLSDDEAARVLALLRKGRGRSLAGEELRVSYRRFKRRYDQDAEFRDAVRDAERCSAEALEAKGYDIALAGDDPAILLKMIGRRDRSRVLAQARADAAAERELRRKELGKGVGWTLGDVAKIGVVGMPLAEQQQFLAILDKQLADQPLDEEEVWAHGRSAVHFLMQLMKAAARNADAR
jgi:hypothetical protein